MAGSDLYLHAQEGKLFLGDSCHAHVIVLNSGNVGIGTTSPGDKLDITAGNLRIQTGGGHGFKLAIGAGNDKWNSYYDNTSGDFRIWDFVNICNNGND